MIKSRFLFIKETGVSTRDLLTDAGYSQLKDCAEELNVLEDKLIIDTENKTFWISDQKCFENAASLIVNTFKNELKEITSDQVKELVTQIS